MPKAVIYGFILGFSLFLSCKSTEKKTLFETIPSSSSGITFSNQLTESATQSIATYEYFYNGAGVAAGDLDSDGYPTFLICFQNSYFCQNANQ